MKQNNTLGTVLKGRDRFIISLVAYILTVIVRDLVSNCRVVHTMGPAKTGLQRERRYIYIRLPEVIEEKDNGNVAEIHR